jgi:hypothetical protein
MATIDVIRERPPMRARETERPFSALAFLTAPAIRIAF